MYWVATGFIFRRVRSPIHRLDPRVRLLIAMELFILAIISFNLPQQLIILTVTFSISLTSKVLSRWARTLLFSTVFASFILVINFIVGYSLQESLVYALRFVAIIASTSIFFLTTSPDELEYVMKWFRIPQDIVFAFVTAVRFVPVLLLDAMQIMDAQRSRGLELDKGNLLSRLKKFVPILIPMVVNAVLRSGELAEAMEARAYGAVKKPTSLYQLRLTSLDTFTATLSVSLIALAIYFFYVVS